MNRNQWKKGIFILGVVFVLLVSFWYGGDSAGLRGFLLSDQKTAGSSQIENENAENVGYAGVEESEEKKQPEEKEDSSIFQQIIMHITKKDKTSNSSNKTQNNKKAQNNANKAAEKSNKNNSDKKTSFGSDTTTANANTTQTKRNENQTQNQVNTDSSESQTAAPSSNNPQTTENAGDIDNNLPDVTETESDTITCTIYISCAALLENMDKLSDAKKKMVPEDGVILDTTTVRVKKGSTVFDVLQKVTKSNKIHLEYSFTPIYKSYYIEGIHNLYEFDCGELSGWMYNVNGEFPGYGCSAYELKDGDVIKWLYTCNLGKDVGGYFEE